MTTLADAVKTIENWREELVCREAQSREQSPDAEGWMQSVVKVNARMYELNRVLALLKGVRQ